MLASTGTSAFSHSWTRSYTNGSSGFQALCLNWTTYYLLFQVSCSQNAALGTPLLSHYKALFHRLNLYVPLSPIGSLAPENPYIRTHTRNWKAQKWDSQVRQDLRKIRQGKDSGSLKSLHMKTNLEESEARTAWELIQEWIEKRRVGQTWGTNRWWWVQWR